MFEDIINLSGIPESGRILEIGCGPGQATVPLARRGYRIRAIELGPELAARARTRVAQFPAVQVEISAFEEAIVEPGSVDLVVCASAFHWLDRPRAYAKIGAGVVSGGALAVFWSAQDSEQERSGFRDAMAAIYARFAPELVGNGRGAARELMDCLAAELSGTGDWSLPIVERDYSWELTYDANAYVHLLGTYSDFIALPADRREGLFAEIRFLIEARFSNRIVRPMYTKLFLARRR